MASDAGLCEFTAENGPLFSHVLASCLDHGVWWCYVGPEIMSHQAGEPVPTYVQGCSMMAAMCLGFTAGSDWAARR